MDLGYGLAMVRVVQGDAAAADGLSTAVAAAGSADSGAESPRQLVEQILLIVTDPRHVAVRSSTEGSADCSSRPTRRLS